MPLFDIENPDTGEIITVDHPQPPTQEEAQQVLASLSVPKGTTIVQPSPLTGQQGQFPLTSQPFSALSRGILNSVLAGTPEAIASQAGAAQEYDASSPQFTNPLTFAIGETLGAFVPVGRIASGAKTLGGLAARGAATGALYGLGGGVSEAATRPESTVKEALKSGIKGAVSGAAVGAAIPGAAAIAPAVTGSISRMASRGLTVPIIEKATGLLPDVALPKVEEILAQAPPRIIEAAGKTLKTGRETIQAAKKAEQIAFNEAVDFLRSSEKEGFVMKGDEMLNSGRENVLQTYNSLSQTPEVLEDILSRPVFNQLRGDISPTKGQKALRELNAEYNRFVDKKSPEALAYQAVRDNLADQLDDIVKLSSGKDIQPYRDYGNIIEFRSGIEGRLEAARQSAGREAVPVSSEPLTGAQSTLRGQLLGSVTRRAGRMLRPLIKQGSEFVDDATESIIKNSPKKLERLDLPEERILILRNQYLPSVNPPDSPTVSRPIAATPTTAPGEFNAPTASVISTLPAEVEAAIAQSAPVPTGILDEDIKAALAQLGIKPSNPAYRTLGAELKRRAEIIQQNAP